MRAAAVAGICAVLLVLAGFSLSHLQGRNKELTRTVMTLRLQVKAQEAAIETHEQALKEAEENARERQKAMEAALQAAGIWSDQQLPDSVRCLLEGSERVGNSPTSCRSIGTNRYPGQNAGQNAGRPGAAVD
ncbi:MAG: hypothetical protein K6F46_11745 [Desulfovibrio sp.]|nr:hypothetical protein [Desulfovibrio sp.]